MPDSLSEKCTETPTHFVGLLSVQPSL